MKAMKLGASSGLDLPLLTSFAIGAQLLSMYTYYTFSHACLCSFQNRIMSIAFEKLSEKAHFTIKILYIVPIHINFLKWHIEKADMGWD